MHMFKVKYVENVDSLPDSALAGWYLDSPRADFSCHDTRDRVLLRGWALSKSDDPVTLVIRRKAKALEEVPVSTARPDVVETLSAQGGARPRLDCGFEQTIHDWVDGFDLGFKVGSTYEWKCSISFSYAEKVQEGRHGWLFLDNDSNNSVDQHTGKLLLHEDELNKWKDYFRELKILASQHSFDWRFVIAPSKETILEEYYLHEPGTYNTIRQFLDFFYSNFGIVWPEQSLSADKEMSYWRGETHWSDYGASLAALFTLKNFGINGSLDSYMYRIERHSGDLGSKYSPSRSFAVPVADYTSFTKTKVFDNEISNHGRIQVYENINSPSDLKCLVFGGSSSLNFLPWIAPYFRRVVFVHSAASVDPALIASERPTHIILQTNQRFIISPAKCDFSIRSIISEKMRAMNLVELESQLKIVKSMDAPAMYRQLTLDGLVAAGISLQQ